MKKRDHLSLAKELVQQKPDEAGVHALIYIAELLTAVHTPQMHVISDIDVFRVRADD